LEEKKEVSTNVGETTTQTTSTEEGSLDEVEHTNGEDVNENNVPEGVDPELVKAKEAQTSSDRNVNRLNPDNDVARNEILKFLSSEMQMNLNDENTVKTLEKMTTEEMKKEFNYDEIKTQ